MSIGVEFTLVAGSKACAGVVVGTAFLGASVAGACPWNFAEISPNLA